MIKILFVCHGNICRSPMAEFVMKDLVAKAGLEHLISVSSCAATYEEIGNDTYPPYAGFSKTRGSLSLNGKHGYSRLPITKKALTSSAWMMRTAAIFTVLPKVTRRKKCPSFSNGQEKIGVSPIRGTLIITKQPTVMYGKAAPRFSKGSCHDFRLPGFLQRLPLQGGQVCPLVLYAELGHRHRRIHGNEISRHDG